MNQLWTFQQTIEDTSVHSLPVPNEIIKIFVVMLHLKGKSYNTIRTTLSGVDYFHKIAGFESIVSFSLKQLLTGIQKESPGRRIRLPITKDILHEVINHLHTTFSETCYTLYLFKSLFLLMFYGCLRVGEVALSETSKHTLTKQQILINNSARNKKCIVVNFNSYKHSKGEKKSLKIGCAEEEKYCPVIALNNYVRVRPVTSHPYMFVLENGTPLKSSTVTRYLRLLIKKSGRNPASYNTHSLRIGRTTSMFKDGVPTRIIKSTGRWRSNAYLKYIKPQITEVPL